MLTEQWLVGFGSLYTLLSLILIILLNAAGTSILNSHNEDKYNTTILSNLHIFELTSYYNSDFDYEDPNYYDNQNNNPVPAWITRFFLNAACATPLLCRGGYCSTYEEAIQGENLTYAETISFWTICHYKSPGHVIDLQATLKTMDRILYGNDTSTFPNAPKYYPYLPPGNWSEPVTDGYLALDTLHTITPFTLWLLGAIACFLYLLGAACWAFYLWRAKQPLVLISSPAWGLEFVGFVLLALAFVGHFVAISYLEDRYDDMIKWMGDAKTETANSIYGSHAFLAVAWSAVISQFLAAIFALCHWRRERRRGLERLRGGCETVETTNGNRRDAGDTEMQHLGDDVREHRQVDGEAHDPPPPYRSAPEEDC